MSKKQTVENRKTKVINNPIKTIEDRKLVEINKPVEIIKEPIISKARVYLENHKNSLLAKSKHELTTKIAQAEKLTQRVVNFYSSSKKNQSLNSKYIQKLDTKLDTSLTVISSLFVIVITPFSIVITPFSIVIFYTYISCIFDCVC